MKFNFVLLTWLIAFVLLLRDTLCKDSYEPTTFTVIAHRGDSGTLPELTQGGFELAILEGSHYLEFDVEFSKDGEMYVRHEPNLINTTNVKDMEQFSDRYTTHVIDYPPEQSGYFIIDFTSEELDTIKSRQTNAFRDSSYDDIMPIPKVEDFFCTFYKANLWREWLSFEASKWNHNSEFNWEFADTLKSIWKGSNGTAPIFSKCLNGVVDFSSSPNSTTPLRSMDGNQVFTYLKPKMDSSSPFNFFKPMIDQFFPFKTTIHESYSSHNWIYTICKFMKLPSCTNKISYFPDSKSAKDFQNQYPDPFGLLVEMKHSAWYKNTTNYNMTFELDQMLHEYHLEKFGSHVIIQSFDQTDLVYFSQKNEFPLVELVLKSPFDNKPSHFKSSDNSFEIVTADTNKMRSIAHAVGPLKELLYEMNPSNGYAEGASFYVKEWKDAGLKIFPWTLRNEYFYIPINFNQDPYREMDSLYNLGVDGFITDFPKTAKMYIEYFIKNYKRFPIFTKSNKNQNKTSHEEL